MPEGTIDSCLIGRRRIRSLGHGGVASPAGSIVVSALDETVRKCWQLDASRFSFTSPQWSAFLDEAVARVRADLGITGTVSAHPYKLLVYGKNQKSYHRALDRRAADEKLSAQLVSL